MTTDKATLGIEELHNAARRLKEILDVPRDHTGRVDAIIRRFELCYELSWKSLRAVLELYGHETPSPRQAFKKAFVMNLIGDENIWLKMLEDRNVISHTYKEKEAAEISERVYDYYESIKKLSETLSETIEKDIR